MTQLKRHRDLRVFDPSSKSWYTVTIAFPRIILGTSARSSTMSIEELDLNRFRLAFTVGTKIIANDIPTLIPDVRTTVLSNEFTEVTNQESDEHGASTNSKRKKSRRSKSPNVQIYKWGPRKGYTDGNEQILIAFANKLKSDKYGG